MTRTISIGCGSISGGDRLEPGAELAGSGLVTYMGFDCLAERTLALAQVRRQSDPGSGYDPRLPDLIRLYTGFLSGGGRLVGNFGQANVDAGLDVTRRALAEYGLNGIRIGVVRGDDVLDAVRAADVELPEMGCRYRDMADQVISAHAYIGAEPVVEALDQGAQIVLGGRLADPSVWVGPICYELGWSLTDWDKVAMATLAGHLLEGGIGRRPSEPDRHLPLGYPLATVDEDGQLTLSKLDGRSGPIDLKAGRLGMAHEIHDPRRYLTPDVTANFSEVGFTEVGPQQLRAYGATGSPPPDSYRVLVGLDLGWKVVGEVSFGGPGCVERAAEQGEVVKSLLSRWSDQIDDLLISTHGVDAVFLGAIKGGYPADCRLRIAARIRSREAAEDVAEIYWRLYGNGGGGVTRAIDKAIGVTPAFLPRSSVDLEMEVVES
ncbi:MAG TPA: acyclic terpene utilization AtuA family protein [Acidimicrobiales bacterium]|nr:acyclic terpene utilization AtuA family protein [Acidimicrobiales bacterium]